MYKIREKICQGWQGMVLSHWVLSNAGQDKQGFQTLGRPHQVAIWRPAGVLAWHLWPQLRSGAGHGGKRGELPKAKMAKCPSAFPGNRKGLEKFILTQS